MDRPNLNPFGSSQCTPAPGTLAPSESTYSSHRVTPTVVVYPIPFRVLWVVSFDGLRRWVEAWRR